MALADQLIRRVGGISSLVAYLPHTPISAVDHSEAIETATRHGSGDSSLFTTALGFLNENKVTTSQSLSPSLSIYSL
jgi:hypothetical protein